jgi:hypothetical protein
MIAIFPLRRPFHVRNCRIFLRFRHPAAIRRGRAQARQQQRATACEVDVSEGFGQSVTVRCDEVETIEFNRDKGIGITVYSGQRKGYASTSDFSAQALRETVEAALNIARFTAEDDCAGLADAALMARDCPDLDLYHPWALSVEESIETARRCEQAAFDASPLVSNSEGASISTQQAHFVSANSLGFMGGYPTSRHYISCSVIAGEQDAMQRDDWYTTHRDATRLDDPLRSAVSPPSVPSPAWAAARSRPASSRSFSKRRWPAACSAAWCMPPVAVRCTANRPSCSTSWARRSCRTSCRSPSARISNAAWAAPPSTATAWRRATAMWSATASCRAIS